MKEQVTDHEALAILAAGLAATIEALVSDISDDERLDRLTNIMDEVGNMAVRLSFQ